MAWTWNKEHLDLILVPFGLSIMLVYHLILLFKFLKYPKKTILGFENHTMREWVEKMMSLEAKDRSLAISVLNSNISGATSLSSISLVLSSLIGAWIGGTTENLFTRSIIYGDTRPGTISIKYITLLACFLAAFACFVQTTRYFIHASFLISMPNCIVPEGYVENAVIRGSNFWSLGLRALYFATTLLMWIFGPIPMFVSAVVMVTVLHHLDRNSVVVKPFKPLGLLEKIRQDAGERHGRPHSTDRGLFLGNKLMTKSLGQLSHPSRCLQFSDGD